MVKKCAVTSVASCQFPRGFSIFRELRTNHVLIVNGIFKYTDETGKNYNIIEIDLFIFVGTYCKRQYSMKRPRKGTIKFLQHNYNSTQE